MGDTPPRKRVLASDAERATTAAWLGVAYAEGRLVPAEYDRRVLEAYGATTRDQLAALTDDLPPMPRQLQPPRARQPEPTPPRTSQPAPAQPSQLQPSRPQPPVPPTRRRRQFDGGDVAVGMVTGLLLGAAFIGELRLVVPGLITMTVLGTLAGILAWVFHDPYGHRRRKR